MQARFATSAQESRRPQPVREGMVRAGARHDRTDGACAAEEARRQRASSAVGRSFYEAQGGGSAEIPGAGVRSASASAGRKKSE